MRAAKTVEIGFVKTVARGIRPPTLALGPDGLHLVLRFPKSCSELTSPAAACILSGR